MISLLLQALVPVAFVIVLGYYSGRVQLISQDGARNFSTYIVNFALPCTLFVGAFDFTPQQFENVPYLLTLVLALMLPFVAAVGVGRLAFKKPLPETSLFACNCGFPDMAYFGLPVLMTVVGAQALLPVIVGNLVTSILMVPFIVLMLHHGTQPDGKGSSSLLDNVLTTVKQPVVWAPILGLILVLTGVTLPSLAKDSLKVIGDTTGGAALFTLGVLLSGLKLRIDLATIIVVFSKTSLINSTQLENTSPYSRAFESSIEFHQPTGDVLDGNRRKCWGDRTRDPACDRTGVPAIRHSFPARGHGQPFVPHNRPRTRARADMGEFR
jgi:malonate transporter and related proteins